MFLQCVLRIYHITIKNDFTALICWIKITTFFIFLVVDKVFRWQKKNWGNSYKKNNYPGQVLCSSSRDMDALVEPNLKAAYWVDLKKKMCMKMNLRTNTFIYDWVILQNNYAWYFSRYNVFTFIYFLKIFNVFSFIFKQVQWS